MPIAVQPLRTPEEAAEAIRRSNELPVWIYKHSPACSISARAIGEFEDFRNDLAVPDAQAPALYQVDVLSGRPASEAIESLTGVRHESPQILLLRGGKCVYHASHGGIRAEELRRRTEEAGGSGRDGGPDPAGAPS